MELDITKAFNEIKIIHELNFDLKPKQAKVMQLLAEGQTVAAIFKTGYGKSVLNMMLPKILDKVNYFSSVHCIKY